MGGLFGAGAFSPQAFMNASSVLNGGQPQDNSDENKKKQLMQSLFQMFRGQQQPMSVNLPSGQPLQQMQTPSLMSLFGGA